MTSHADMESAFPHVTAATPAPARTPTSAASSAGTTTLTTSASATPAPAVAVGSADSLSSVDDYGALDDLSKPVTPTVQSASRYRRLDGEPTLAFFRRERNSLSAYTRPSRDSGGDGVSGEGLYNAGEDDWDEAMNRLEKRAVMSGAVRDDERRGGYLGNDRRFEVRNQRVQREKRQSLKQLRAAKLMQTLKFLLTMKGK